MTLSTPSPNQAGIKRKATPIDELEHRPPLRPRPADLATGDTAGERQTKSRRGTSENKQIHNNFRSQKARFEAAEPELFQHMVDIQKHASPGCPQVLHLKKVIGNC